MTKMKLVGLGLLWGSLVMAQTPPPGMENARKACAADKEKLCAGVQPGGGRIIQCLQTHLSEVSDGCKTAMQQVHGKHHGGGGAPPPGAGN